MHKTIKYIIAASVLATANINTGYGQVLPAVETKFDAYQRMAFQEKLYVHTNKDIYLAGEILWFKLYNVDAKTNQPVNVSKVAYVEILGADHAPVIQAKIALKNGTGSGSVYVPAGIANGNYQLRAYTNWMKNFSPDYFFEKNLTVVNAQRSPEALAATDKPVADVQFFAEGGHLVRGLSSKMAFKVTGTNGLGVAAFKGAVINQKNDTVARFVPFKFGMGSFNFIPLAGDSYKAVVKINNKTVVKELPAIDEQGYTMQVTDNGPSWSVAVKSNAATAENVYLFAHTRQVTKQVLNAVLSNGSTTFTVDKAKMGEGLSHLTLFNGSNSPLCERLVYKQPLGKLNINAQTNEAVYSTRKKVALNINTANGAKASAANLSVSVFRADSLAETDGLDINSYLWLTSELRGHIEGAAWYFDGSAQATEGLDNLLLTQGWRRFEWNNVLTGKPDLKFIPEYTGHIITGKLTDAAGAPAKNIHTFLSIPGPRVQMFASVSDSAGRLLFNTKDFYGNNEVVVQNNTEVDSIFKAQIFSPFAEQFSSTQSPAFSLNSSMRRAIEENNLNMQVLNIYNAPKLREFYNPGVDTMAFFGKPTKSYLLDAYVRFTTVEEVFREYTSWLMVGRRRGKFKVTMYNEKKILDDNPLILYNGIPVFDMNKAFALDPLKIRKLEVVPDRYLYGPARFDGILSFSTYKEDLAGFEIDPRATVLDYEGLQLQRKFYSPVYDTEAQIKSRIPDFRSALFWEPDVYTDTQGKTSLSFFTSDQRGKYTVIVQGLATGGQAGSKQFTIEVK